MSLTVHAYVLRGAYRLEADLTVGDGLTLVSGASGAGKTTLLRMLAGLERPSAGEIAFDGQILSNAQVFIPAWERGFVTAFQDARLLPHASVRDNLLFARKRGRGAAAIFEDVEPVLEALGLVPLLSRRIGGLSGGERQRVGLGRALLSQARLLLLDEPTAMLDQERQRLVFQLIRQAADRCSVLVASHLEAPLANRVIRVENGKAALALSCSAQTQETQS